MRSLKFSTVLAVALAAHAQATRGTVSGTILDLTGAVLAGAHVSLIGVDIVTLSPMRTRRQWPRRRMTRKQELGSSGRVTHYPEVTSRANIVFRASGGHCGRNVALLDFIPQSALPQCKCGPITRYFAQNAGCPTSRWATGTGGG
jgi:hypothetical protein